MCTMHMTLVVTENIEIHDIVGQINRECKTELNIFINLNYKSPNATAINQQFMNASRILNYLPKLIKTNENYLVEPIQKIAVTEQILIVAWLTWDTLNTTVQAIDTLLWQLHYKDILLIYHHRRGKLDPDIMAIFKICWKYGFTSVVLKTGNQLFTYHPYPVIQIKNLTNLDKFMDKTHLNNFQLYTWPQPTIELAPRFSSYRNRLGQQMYTGYVYKLISTFLQHHNGTIRYHFVQINADNVTLKSFLNSAKSNRFTFSPFLTRSMKELLGSKTVQLTRLSFMVPTAREVSRSLYIVIPLEGLVYVVILFAGLLFFLLIIVLTYQEKHIVDYGYSFLEAFKIIIFLSVNVTRRNTIMAFLLSLLFMFTGIFLTNNYSSSLASLFASKVFEPPLERLIDIERTTLRVYMHSVDLAILDQMEYFPTFLRQRMFSKNDTELFIFRKQMNMEYIYIIRDDIIDYFLSQQIYLKRPIAMKLKQPVLYQPLLFHLPHRSPLLEQFNRYLSYLCDSGLFDKFIEDTYWEGYINGDLHVLLDPALEEALEMKHFQNAFAMLTIGYICALISVIVENIVYSNRIY